VAAFQPAREPLNPLTFTLVSDGSSDRALIPVLSWLLRQHSTRDFVRQWADLRQLRQPARSLSEKIERALILYPCDLLFIHRDAEGESRDVRVAEIQGHLVQSAPGHPAVCVVPVRMQEAWLLFNEAVIRLAADNPRGRMLLELPSLERLEDVADPKDLLWKSLVTASGLRPGRRHRFLPAARTHRVAELIEDFSPLRKLSAFQALEEDVKTTIAERHWQ
jgi:hypothetical protein